LVEKGEKVAHLLLIDPVTGRSWLRWAWLLVNKTGDILKWNLQKKIHYFDRTAVSFARWIGKPMRSKVAALSRRLGLKSRTDSSPTNSTEEAGEGGEILNQFDYAVYFLAYRLYRPRPLSVPATLYFPEETPSARLAWVQRASERASVKFTVEVLPGDHHTCITRYTPTLVDKIKKTLDGV